MSLNPLTVAKELETYERECAELRAEIYRLRKVLEVVRKKARLAQALCVTTEDNAGLLMVEIEAEVGTALREKK
jgi:hypothetical protein